MNAHYVLTTDHFQFYLADENFGADTSSLWNKQAMENMLAADSDIISVGTVRFGGRTNVFIEVRSVPAVYSTENWSRVVECSIKTSSGVFMLFAPESNYDDTPRIKVEPGVYSVLVLYENLESVADEMAQTGDDIYHLLLWPGEFREIVVKKS